MVKTTGTKISLLSAIAVVVGYGITSWGQADIPTVQYIWTAPTTGSAVAYYVGELESWPTAGGDTTRVAVASPDTSVAVSYAYGYTTRLRVAGVDSTGRQGPFSVWSDQWSDDGPPGEPSMPLAGLVMVAQ